MASQVVGDAAGGAVLGAGVGSIIPGIGTVAGGLAGGALGALVGLFGDSGSGGPSPYTPVTPQGGGAPQFSATVDQAALQAAYQQWFSSQPVTGDAGAIAAAAQAWMAQNASKFTTYTNLATGEVMPAGSVLSPGVVVQGQDGKNYVSGQNGALTLAPNYDAYQLGAAFGMTPGQLYQQQAAVGAIDQSILANAGAQTQGMLGSAANNAFGSAGQILTGAQQLAAYQQGLGAAGLNQAQALADYNTALGQSAMSGMSALGQQANQASAYYGGQQADLMANQADLQNSMLGALASANATASSAEGALSTGANNANAAAAGALDTSNYYAGQGAAAGAAAGQNQGAAGQYLGNLYSQGQANQQTLSNLAGVTTSQGDNATRSLYQQGAQDQAALSNLSAQAGQQGQAVQGNLANQAYYAQSTGVNAQNQFNNLGNQANQQGTAAANNLYGLAQSANATGQNYGTALYNQGQQNQQYLQNLGSQTTAQGQSIGNALTQQGFGAQNLLTGQGQQATQQGFANQATMAGLGGQAFGTGSYYAGQGAQETGNSAYDRLGSLASIGQLQNFVNQPLDVPSAADAQFKLGLDQNFANSIALARSGRGAGDVASNMRQAMFSNAATQQQSDLQYAQLRAQEIAAGRQAQLSGMTQIQNALGGLRGQDISSAQALGGLGSTYAQFGGNLVSQGQQNALGYGQLGANLMTQGQQLGQSGLQAGGQLALGYGQLGQAYNQGGAQLGQAATQGAAGIAQQGEQIAGNLTQAGANAQLGFGQLAGNLYNQGGQLGLGYNQLAGNLTQAGGQLGLGYGQLAGNLYQAGSNAALQANQAAGQLGLGYGQLAGNLYNQGAQLGQNATQAAAAGAMDIAAQQVQQQQLLGNLGVGYGNLGLGFNQLGASQTQAAGNLGIAAGNLSTGAIGQLGAQNAALTQAAGTLGLGYGNLGQNYFQSGLTAQNQANATAQNALATGLGFQQGISGVANQGLGQGLNAFTNLTNQGNTLTTANAGIGMQTAGAITGIDQFVQQQQLQMAQNQLQAYVSMYGADRGVAIAQMQAQATGDAALLGAVSTFGAGLLTSSGSKQASTTAAPVGDMNNAG